MEFLQMHPVLAAATEGGGAPLGQLAIITAFTTTIAALVALVAMAYRQGRAPRVRRFVTWVEGLVGLPGWSAVPGIAAIAFCFIIITGATWDIGLHIDNGRDEGPLGTAAHYPLLLGLFGAFLAGILAIGLAPRQRKKNSPVAIRIKGYGYVPAASLMLLAGSAFGMAAFPLDDLWHRIFGQDVTLWGPTHTMIIGGTIGAGIGGALLLIEGALAAGRKPFGEGGIVLRPLPCIMGGIFLYFWAATTDEFNWGIQQYREIWQPFLLAFGGAQALVLARLLAGRGGALGALLVWLPVQIGMSLVIGGPLEVTMPSTPLFVAEALIVELVALTPLLRKPTRFGIVAGAGVGTLGFAATYAWTQVAMPIPWTTALLPEAIPVALIAGIFGGILGATMARALRGEIEPGDRRALWGGAVLPIAVFVALGFNAADVRNPAGVTATITTSEPRLASVPNHDAPQRAVDVTVTVSDPSMTDNPHWFTATAWQGGGRYLNHLKQQADGSWKTTQPVPIDGTWKSMIRLHDGRAMLAAPIYFAADPAIEFAGHPLQASSTRPMIYDHKLLQIERREGGVASWGWRPASLLVLSLNLLMVALMAFVAYRIGRIQSQPLRVETPSGSLIAAAAQGRRWAQRTLGGGTRPGTAS